MSHLGNMIRWMLSFTIVAGMTFSFITNYELYPLAPYTMYAAKYDPSDFKILFVELKNPDKGWENIHYELIKPFDEARLKQSLMHAYGNENGNANEDVKQKAIEIIKLAKKNTGISYKQARLRFVTYDNLYNLRNNKYRVINERIFSD